MFDSKTFLLRSALLALLIPVAAQAAEPASRYTLTGNINVLTDYRFRGISQTAKGPAIQGGFDFAHTSGFYIGNWNSNVASGSFPGGNGAEMDFYGGYKIPLGQTGITLDVGDLYYYYDKARFSGTNQKYNNNEVYAGLSYGPFSGKLFYATTDYFGLNSTSAASVGLTPRGNSKGSTYLDLTYAQEVMPKLTLTAHAGYTRYKNYTDLSYTDYKLGAAYDYNGFMLGAAFIGNSSEGSTFNAFNTAGSGTGNKALYKNTVVLSVGKTF